MAQAERGELVTLDQIAIGVDEETAGELLRASLPRDVTVMGTVVRIESALPLFRGNQAGLVFRGRVHAMGVPEAFAAMELGGTLDSFELDAGRLSAGVKLIHVGLRESSLGKLGGGRMEQLVRDNLPAIERAIPRIEIPVGIEQSVGIDIERMGPVTVKPGRLPLRITVARVVPVSGRLWILLQADVGQWQQVVRADGP